MSKLFSLSLSSILLLTTLAQHDEFQFPGFKSNNLTLSGAASVNSNGILRLTTDTSRDIGHAFHAVPIRFKNSTDGSLFSFSTAFAFSIVPPYQIPSSVPIVQGFGGHGLAFTIANSSTLPDAYPVQYLGLLNTKNMGNASNHLFAVEFDTAQDFEFDDINDNHVGIDLNNLASNKSVAAPYNLKSGDTMQAWIDYDGKRKVLDVWLNMSSKKPAIPIISYPVDLSTIFLNEMHVGFSASTGILASFHYIIGWNFKMNGVANSLNLSFLPSLPKPKKKNNASLIAAPLPMPKKKNYALLIAAPVSALLFLIIVVAAAGYLFYKIKTTDVIEDWELVTGPHRFSYKELKQATKSFREKELLGQGGFGKVYRGVLPGTKEEVAVKRMSDESKQGLREFMAEIASIGRLRHRNLVRMQGWCRRRADLLLVYEQWRPVQ